jgi:hypothetical protein
LDVQAAEIVLEETVRPAGRIRDLELLDGKAYACGPWGLSVVDTHGGLQAAVSVHGGDMAGLTALEDCGSRLCGSRLRPRGLAVYEPDGQSGVTLVGQSVTSGLGWDLAVKGTRAYVAHGIFGVGVYDIRNPVSPEWIDAIMWTGGRVVTVAARKELLAVGRKDGHVLLYDIAAGGVEQVGELNASGRISRLDFRAGYLWVLGHRETAVEVFDLEDPANPVREGSFSAGAAEHFQARTLGARAITFSGRDVEAYRFEPESE